MDCQTALRDLGVRDGMLTDDEKMRLDRAGYLPLEGILSLDEVARMGGMRVLTAHR